MRILQMCTSLRGEGDLFNAGDGVHNAAIRRAFEALGHEVVRPEARPRQAGVAVASGGYAVLKAVLPKLATDAARDLYAIARGRATRRRLRQLIEQQRPDVVYERFFHFHDGLAKAAKALGWPYVVEMHTCPEELRYYQVPVFGRYYASVQHEVARSASLVVVVSEYLAAYYRSAGVDSRRLLVVPNGIDPTVFCARGQRETTRRAYGFDRDAVVVGFVGSMQPFHGMQMLPEISSRVRVQVPKARFLVVGGFGKPEAQASFEAQMREVGVGAEFVCTGQVLPAEVPALIEAMDICIMPDSNQYGSPIKLFEYGAMGKPCVMPGYGPILEVLRHGENGLVFAPRDLEACASHIIELARDPALGARLGEALREIVLERHTWEGNAALILRRLAELEFGPEPVGRPGIRSN